MKRFDKIFIAIIVTLIAMIIAADLSLLYTDKSDHGRPYRVEVSRLVQQIKAGQTADLSGCDHVTAVTKYSDDPQRFYDADSDYLIRQIDGELYRFDYTPAVQDDSALITMNIALVYVVLMVIGILLFLRQKILRPFQVLTDVPYELSKGNLTIPIRESKSRFFGRFVWGVDLLRENMEQQKQRELELQKEKNTLLLSLSHDLKTPLSAIKLYAKALSRGLYTDKEKQLQIVSSIDAKADEIEGFVSQIIQASNEDFLSLEVSNGEFYLSQLMDQICGYYRDKLSLVKIGFTVAPYTNCLICGDLDRGVEVIQNLMENAIKYGDGERIDLLLSEEDGYILISVQNSGCTLLSAELPHIFDSFWRGSNADKHKGSGLGLYICRQLMHKMGGEIFAETSDGRMIVTTVFPKV